MPQDLISETNSLLITFFHRRHFTFREASWNCFSVVQLCLVSFRVVLFKALFLWYYTWSWTMVCAVLIWISNSKNECSTAVRKGLGIMIWKKLYFSLEINPRFWSLLVEFLSVQDSSGITPWSMSLPLANDRSNNLLRTFPVDSLDVRISHLDMTPCASHCFVVA